MELYRHIGKAVIVMNVNKRIQNISERTEGRKPLDTGKIKICECKGYLRHGFTILKGVENGTAVGVCPLCYGRPRTAVPEEECDECYEYYPHPKEQRYYLCSKCEGD